MLNMEKVVLLSVLCVEGSISGRPQASRKCKLREAFCGYPLRVRRRNIVSQFHAALAHKTVSIKAAMKEPKASAAAEKTENPL